MATKQHGGKRRGAGRPAGSKNTLPFGAVRAIKALRHRVPEDAPEELADVAGEAFEAVVDVMRGKFADASNAQAVLRASVIIREEVCGPQKQKAELDVPDGVSVTITRTVKP